MQLLQLRRRDRGEGVQHRVERAQPGEQAVALGRVAQVRDLDDDELPAAQELGDLRQRRHLQQAAHAHQLVRRDPVSSCQAPSTSRARSQGQSSMPAYTSAIG